MTPIISDKYVKAVMEEAEIFIWKDGGKLGPFPPSVIASSISLGSVSPETPAWTLDDPTWRTAVKILEKYSKHEESLEQRHPAPPHLESQNNQSTNRSPAVQKPINYLEIGLIVGVILALLLIFLLLQPYYTNEKPLDTEASNKISSINDAPKPSSDAPTVTNSVRAAVSIEEAEKCVLMVRWEDGAGTAFIAKDGEICYVYTNVHVASYKNLEFYDFRGKCLKVSSQGQVVGKPFHLNLVDEPGIDIVRFPLLESPEYSLRFASRETIEKRPEVWTLGDSGGEGILKTLRGHIKGVGPTRIEVDCEFIQGNSGGPIVTSRGEVVGIASYLKANQTIWARGTEQEIRRYAWIPGRNHTWIDTSFDELTIERELVAKCCSNTAFLYFVSLMITAKDGFHTPDKFPQDEDDQNLLEIAEAHPLWENLHNVDKQLSDSSQAGTATQNTAHQEFVKFFDSCGAFQESQLDKTEQEIQSSFWRKELDEIDHKNCLQNFQKQTARYRDLGQVGKALNDF